MTTIAPVMAAEASQPSRKRLRSREPDWLNFYRNGLPKEVIVIDDSPGPEANTARKINTNSNSCVLPPIDLTTQPNAKRRRKADPPSQHQHQQQQQQQSSYSVQSNGYHIQYSNSTTNGHTSQKPNNVSSTLSSSSSVQSNLQTTAPTSLSSNGQYEEVQPVIKRKRTRQQVANEAKRRDIDGLGDPLFTYKPPPFLPIKAADVYVRQVREVRKLLFPVCVVISARIIANILFVASAR